jgi:streptogramin lyase
MPSNRKNHLAVFLLSVATAGTGCALDTNSEADRTGENVGVTRSALGGYTLVAENDNLSGPFGIAIDSSNNIYVAELGDVAVLNTGLVVQSHFDADAEALAIDPAWGFIYGLSDDGVSQYLPDGTLHASYGSVGTGDGQFEHPYGIAVDPAGRFYVADSYNNRIQVFDSGGNFVRKWGTFGTGNGQFDQPYGITVDSSFNVYVSEIGNNRVQQFTRTGTYVTQWGSTGTGHSQFRQAFSIAKDASGNVYVGDQDNRRVQKFSSSGTYLTDIGSGVLGGAFGVAVDSSNNVYVVDDISIFKFSP